MISDSLEQRNLRDRCVSIGLAAISLAWAFAAFAIFRARDSGPGAVGDFLPWWEEALGAAEEGSTFHLKAYQVFLLWTALAAIFVSMAPRLAAPAVDRISRIIKPLRDAAVSRPIPVAAVLVVAAVLASRESVLFVLVCGVAGILLIAAGFLDRRRRWSKPAVIGLGAGYVLGVCVWGFAVPSPVPIFQDHFFAFVEWHHAAFYGAAARLVSGIGLEGANPGYGTLSSVVVSAIQSRSDPWGFSDYIRFTQVTEVVAVAVAFVTAGFWSRWRPVYCLFVLLAVLPFFHPAGSSIVHPTQSALRFAAFFLVPLCAVLTRKKSPWAAAFWLGAVCGVALYWNPETGLFMVPFSALVTVTRIGRCQWAGIFRVLGGLLAGGFAGSIVSWLLIGILSGSWSEPHPVFTIYGGTLQGFSGFPYVPDLFEIVMIVTALAILFRRAISWSRRPLHFFEAFTLAAAAIVLGWFIYYLTRTGPVKLAGCFYFFFLMLLPIFRVARWRAGGLPRRKNFVAIAVFSLVLFPVLVSMHETFIWKKFGHIGRAVNRAEARKAERKMTVNHGLFLPVLQAELLDQKVDALRTLHQNDSLIFFSANSFSLTTDTRIAFDFSRLDFWGTTKTPEDLENLVKETLERDSHLILFDDPASLIPGTSAHQAFFREMQKRLKSRYRPDRTEFGWEIWRKFDPET